MCLPSIRCCSFFVVGVVIFGGGGFIFVARHKSGQSYPFLNERVVGHASKKIKKNFDIQIIVFIFAVV